MTHTPENQKNYGKCAKDEYFCFPRKQEPHRDMQEWMVEVAEKIVIEYADISGRESDHRTYVRAAALKVLPEILLRREKEEEVSTLR